VQGQITVGEILGLNNAEFEAHNEVENLSSYELLKLMWKENRKEDRVRQEQVIKQFREDVEKMREGLVEKCEERASKMATDLSHLERKPEQSIAEILC
jgi:hypothetical protein